MTSFFELSAQQIKEIYKAGTEQNFEMVLEIIQKTLNEGKSIHSKDYLHLLDVETILG